MQLPHAPSRQHWPQTAERGFTVIELMVVVTIMAVLAALATPSFTPIIERWRVRQAANGLESTLYYARSEAIKRGGDITVVATSGADWATGWSVCAGACSASTTLQTSNAPDRVSVTPDPAGGTITLDRWGRMNKGAGVSTFGFRLVPQGKLSNDSSAASLCINGGAAIKRQATAC